MIILSKRKPLEQILSPMYSMAGGAHARATQSSLDVSIRVRQDTIHILIASPESKWVVTDNAAYIDAEFF